MAELTPLKAVISAVLFLNEVGRFVRKFSVLMNE